MAFYDTDKIKLYYDDFTSYKNAFSSDYNNYKNSYIVTSGDYTINLMQRKFDTYFQRLNNAYNKIQTQWKDFYDDLINTDSVLAGEKSVGSIKSAITASKINLMPKLEDYNVNLSVFNGVADAMIKGATASIVGVLNKNYQDPLKDIAMASAADGVMVGAISGTTAMVRNNVSQLNISDDISSAAEKPSDSTAKDMIKGAAIGSLIGTLILPGFGAILGGAVGAVVSNDGIVSKIKDWVKGLGEGLKDIFNSLKDSAKQMVNDLRGLTEAESFDDVLQVFKRTSATLATAATSLVEGVFKLGEDIVDLVALVGTAVASIGTGILDLGNLAMSKITGDESVKTSYTKQMWEKTRSFVATDYVGNLFDKFYDNTTFGQWMKDNAYGFDTTRAVGTAIGEVLGVIAITVLTAGVGGAALGTASSVGAGVSAAAASTAVTTTGAAITYGALKAAEHTETNWQDENTSTAAGFFKGVSQGVLDGLFFAAGAKGDQVLRSSAKAVASNIGKDASKEVVRAAQKEVIKKLGLKMAYEGGTAVAQDLGTIGLDVIFSKDTITDANGNIIKLNSFRDKFNYYFNQAGGVKGLAQSVITAVGLSAIADRADSINIVNKAARQGQESGLKQALKDVRINGSSKLSQLTSSVKLKLTDGKVAASSKVVGLGKALKNFTGNSISKVKNKINNSAVGKKAADVAESLKTNIHKNNVKIGYKFDQLKASATLKLASGGITATSKVIDLGKALKNFTGDSISKVKNKINNSAVGKKAADVAESLKTNIHKNNVKIGYKFDQLKASATLKLASGGITATSKVIDLGKALKNFTGDFISKARNKINGSAIKQKVTDSVSSARNKLGGVGSSITKYSIDKVRNINTKLKNGLNNVKFKLTTGVATLGGKAIGLKNKLKATVEDGAEKIKIKRQEAAERALRELKGNVKSHISFLKSKINVLSMDPKSTLNSDISIYSYVFEKISQQHGVKTARYIMQQALDGKLFYVTEKDGLRDAMQLISNDSRIIIKQLEFNPNIEYRGGSRVKFGGQNGQELNVHQLYDKGNNVLINIQENYNSNNNAFGLTVNEILEAYNSISSKGSKLLEKIKELNITDIRNPDDSYWAIQQNTIDFKSAATGGGGVINIYKYSDVSTIEETLAHEIGHNIDNLNGVDFGISDSTEWINAVKNDGGSGITNYADESLKNRTINKYSEDFAESLSLLYTKGGSWFSARYPNRAQILKQICPELF